MDSPNRDDRDDSPEHQHHLSAFRASLSEGGFLSGVGRLRIAVSGGADSVALALLFRDLRDAACVALPELSIGHVHHGIRGAEADEDEAFVRRLSASWGMAFRSERVDVPRYAEREGLSMEVAARRLRYDVFRRWASFDALDAIALAHHREDQEETVLLRLARGTGIRGLGGIPGDRPLTGCDRPVRIVRPLLAWSPDRLRDILRRRGQSFRHDRSNDALEIPRNRVRIEVLPWLEERMHPGLRASLRSLAASATQLTRDLEQLAGRALEDALVSHDPDAISLRKGALAGWPPSVLREVLVALVARVAPGQPAPSARATHRFDDLVRGEDGREADLGEGLGAESRFGRVTLFVTRDAGAATARATPLSVGGDPVPWREWCIGVERAARVGSGGSALEEWIDGDRLEGPLAVRSRREGDVFFPLGAPGQKKLKEFFRERRIPPRLRDARPLVVSGANIVWVVGERLAHPWRVRPDTQCVLRLHARRVEG